MNAYSVCWIAVIVIMFEKSPTSYEQHWMDHATELLHAFVCVCEPWCVVFVACYAGIVIKL